MTTRSTRNRIWWVAALVVMLGGAVACSSSSDSASMAMNEAAMTGAAGMAGPPNAMAGGSAAADAKAAPSGQVASVALADTRQVIKTADLQVRLHIAASTTDDKLAAAQRDALETAVNTVRSQVIAAQGFVGDLKQSASSASLVLRVPATAYDSMRQQAGAIGELTAQTESAADVTDQYTDVSSRIASMQASLDRLRTLLGQATAVNDIISIESQLTTRQAELESLQGRLAVLKDQVALATISMTITAQRDGTPEPPIQPDRSGFLGGLADGWDAFVNFMVGLGAFLGMILPFLPLIALVWLATWWFIRRSRARQAATSPAPQPLAPGPMAPGPMEPGPMAPAAVASGPAGAS